MATMPKHVGVK